MRSSIQQITRGFPVMVLLLLGAVSIPARAQQQIQKLSLDQAVDSALQHNHQLKIKEYQLQEKRAGIKEARVKQYPSVTVSSTYRYNENVGSLEIPGGTLGSLPLSPTATIALPQEDIAFELGEHENFNAGVSLYQPITQQAKIRTGVQVSKAEASITSAEKDKAVQQITLAVEKLYYAILINQQKQEEAKANLELSEMELHDAESALQAGKTVEASKTALMAEVADKKQELLKLKIEAEDHRANFENLTGISLVRVELQEVEKAVKPIHSLSSYKTEAAEHNVDLRLASLKQEKSELAVKAARQNYLPDLGLIAGYTYQKGSTIYPEYNPYVGINFKWNLQDIFSDRQVVNQRRFVYQQARENRLNTREQIDNEVEKAYRKLAQIKALVGVAREAADYRREAYQIQQDRNDAGLNKRADLLDARASLAKSEADLYAARLQYRLALSRLKMVAGSSDRPY